ncbi:DEK domain-containing chromatin-associated protein 4-like [Cornus florida]|uniref:DEK domain-containing chromatin-associated protein 4-like n=1 Tax=Cornus florida TaxID=4283 RepID=UPI002899871A|nr:DEK domain-containing chromatin-associated protein 4-like [Cornus florida]XP_059666553.1 DEK domain-containing chromatin-associated protein 4-like [Cornus florida]XP_059666554.1 DEK domain-containing chromatin-associated protein 4-like [Cornus florida]XP_059666555.1 DEK domain-containing chromatin-associated protein 4-like [Cornus florida]
MGMEDTVAEVAAYGTSSLEKIGELVTQKKVEEKDEVKENEEDGRDGDKVENHKMDVDQEGKETNQEEKEETKSETMEEEIMMKGNGESKKKVDVSGEEEEMDVDQEGKVSKETKEKEGKEEKYSKEEVEEEEEKGETNDDTKEEVGGKEEKAEESRQKKGSKRHRKGKNAGVKVNNKKKVVKEKKKDPKTPVIYAIERPVRERKSVERLVESIEKEAVKDFNIEKGRGTALKDIPNVAYKLSKKKTDDTLKLLHTILFGRRAKALQVKSNISQFSGFVWNQNEEKQKTKVKEKFDKCIKEKLLEFCDVLDIPTAKANIRKEDIVMKLIDFLVAPHATTNELLADKEQTRVGKKRRRVVKESASLSGNTPSQSSAKRRRKIESTSTREVKRSTPEVASESEEEDDEEEKNVNIVPERTKDEMPEHSDSEAKENNSEDESQDDGRKQKRGLKKSSANRRSAGKAKNVKIKTPKKASLLPKGTPTNSSSSRSKVDHSTDTSSKLLSRKKKNEEVVKEKSSTPKRSASKNKNGKKIAKGKDKPKEDKRRPSDDELRNAVCQILKEVDFNTATFTDILKHLAGRFNTDLTPRKSSIKLMIQDELTKLAEEGDDEEEEGDVEKDEETRHSNRCVEV